MALFAVKLALVAAQQWALFTKEEIHKVSK